MTYRPSPKVQDLLTAMDREPLRVWSNDDAAALMGLVPSEVRGQLEYAVMHGRIYRGKCRNRLYFATARELLPVDPRQEPRPAWNPATDIRVPKFDPLWKPPVMRCARHDHAPARAFAGS